MSLVTWNGKLLLTNGKLTLGPAAPECCCEGPSGTCCGRLVPGNTSEEGSDYYPLTLHCKITKGTCVYPDPPAEFDLTWDPTDTEWISDFIDMGDIPLAQVHLTCAGIGTYSWDGRITWGVCGCGGVGSSCSFTMTPTLNPSGECDPLDLDVLVTMIGLMCCGNMSGGTITIEVWE